MLRKDIKKLKAVLSLLYINLSFFFIKGENVFMKRKWYSLRLQSVPLMNLITIAIPNAISSQDADAAEIYSREVNDCLITKDKSRLYQVVYDQFTSFVQRNKFRGALYDFSNKDTKIGILYRKLLGRLSNFRKRSVITEAVKALPQKLRSLEEILSEELNIGGKVVGLVKTGNADFDSQFRQILRYSNVPQVC